MKDIIQKRLETFEIENSEDELNALKKITQEVALYSLKKAGFFEETCLLGGDMLKSRPWAGKKIDITSDFVKT